MAAGHDGSIQAHHDGIKAFAETGLTGDLEKFAMPTPVMYGDDDQIVPIDAAGRMSATIVKDAKRKVCVGYPHGMCATNPDFINADPPAFVKSQGCPDTQRLKS